MKTQLITINSLTTGAKFLASDLKPISNTMGFFTAYCEEFHKRVILFESNNEFYLDNNQ